MDKDIMDASMPTLPPCEPAANTNQPPVALNRDDYQLIAAAAVLLHAIPKQHRDNVMSAILGLRQVFDAIDPENVRGVCPSVTAANEYAISFANEPEAANLLINPHTGAFRYVNVPQGGA